MQALACMHVFREDCFANYAHATAQPAHRCCPFKCHRSEQLLTLPEELSENLDGAQQVDDDEGNVDMYERLADEADAANGIPREG